MTDGTRFVGASSDEAFDALRKAARERGDALRAAAVADALATAEDRDDDDDESDDAPVSPPSLPPLPTRDTMVAKRLSSLARMLGLAPSATRLEIQAAIDQLSRADVREQMRHRLGGLGR